MRRDRVLLAMGYAAYAISMALPAIEIMGVKYGYACFLQSHFSTATLPFALLDPGRVRGEIDLISVSLVMGSWLNTWMLTSWGSGWIPWRKWRVGYAGAGLLGCLYFLVWGWYVLPGVYFGFWVWLLAILSVAAVLIRREWREEEGA